MQLLSYQPPAYAQLLLLYNQTGAVLLLKVIRSVFVQVSLSVANLHSEVPS